PSFFSQVCNCDKYLKVPKERMRQLVEGSRHPLGDSSAGCPAPREEEPSQTCSAVQPTSTEPGERLEGTGPCGAAAGLLGGTALQVAAIPPGVLDKADLTDFYCCVRCGKVFWEGSHFGRIVSQFQDILVATGDKQHIYKLS
ncbi:MUT7 Exonuclease, partial [Odontophorus gujanensis]|nr:MUT7 Exonuclease [Odontophorus gujanensis]